jgi:HD-like signal output (HDOD) protein
MLICDDFKRAIQAIDALGATPAVLLKVKELAKDPNTDLSAICALLRNDGPLAADIIRISNSPFYAPATFHSNLNSSVNYIGLREVIRVVNLSLSRQLFARDLASYGVSARDYWSASVAGALVMEALAKHTGLNSEDAYTLGILHAIGRVLINRVIEGQGFTIYWDASQPIADWERSAAGFDYAQAGAMLLEHWNFPTPTCDVIRWQLDSEKVVEPVSLLGSLQFTQRLLVLTGLGFEKSGWCLPETDSYVRASGLTAALVEQFISTCREDFQHILQTVDLE